MSEIFRASRLEGPFCECLQSKAVFDILETNMLNVRSTRVILLILLIPPVVGVTGCSVFGTVGGWFSQGYENTVAYFNAYYNAKTLFDEAEAEVLAAQLAAKGKSAQAGTPGAPAATSKQKFSLVIDKCSNILAFSPTSSVVDDALFLIGKSFFYQEDYVKAERKFTELIAQYPNSELVLDGELWLLKTLHHLKRYDDATKVGQNLAESATAADENAIAAEAYATLGDVALAQEKPALALEEYRKAIADADNDKTKAEFALKAADLFSTLQQYDKAANAYLDVEQYSGSPYALYYSQLQAAISFRNVSDFDRALSILSRIESDYRFFDYRGTIRLERAETFSQAGRLEEAVEAYKLVDSLYYKTEVGAKGAFQLAQMFQLDLHDFASAKLAYDRAAAAGPLDQVQQAQRMSSALGRYFTLWRDFGRADSILTICDEDSMWIARDSTGAPIFVKAAVDSPKASSLTARIDTGKVKPDSSLKQATLAKPPTDTLKRGVDTTVAVTAEENAEAKSSKPAYRIIPRPDRNTIAASRALAAYQLGELFHADLDAPDSTYFWLNKSVHYELDSVKAPRALYLMAGIANADSLGRFGNAKELYRFITESYSKSNVAEESRIALGLPPTIKTTDIARARFFLAESLFHAGFYQQAVDSLTVLAKETTDSTYLPKSLYTMAWIYEHDLNEPDSAIARYKTVAMKFGATHFGAAAARRIPPPPPPDSSKLKTRDSTKIAPPGSPAFAPTDSTLKRAGAPTLKVGTDTTHSGSSAPKMAADTTGLGSLLKKANPDSTKKVLDLDVIEQKPVRRDSTKSRRTKETVEK